jgi:hypothetical protein
VDKLVQRVESMVDRHYGDKKTAYVFTADHGMSNKVQSCHLQQSTGLATMLTWSLRLVME